LQKELNELMKTYSLSNNPILKYPPPNHIPINGLKIHQDGYTCSYDGCIYTVLKKSSMQTHWKLSHADKLHLVKSNNQYHHPIPIQSYFSHMRNKYWTVNPDLAGRDTRDLYRMFMTEFLPGFETTTSFQEPTLPRDIPPWLKVSGFHEYLGDYVTDHQKRNRLVDAATHPRIGDPIFGQLHDWVFEYMKIVRERSRTKVPYTFMKYIISLEDR